jgi:hypothetical protein
VSRKSRSYERLSILSVSSDVPPTPIFKRSKGINSILDLDPLEVARQLTLLEWRLFAQIKSSELLKQQFSKKNGQAGAPHVKSMSAMSTLVRFYLFAVVPGD